MEEKNTDKYKKGFESGFSQLRIGDKDKATELLYKALLINNRVSFSQYKQGLIEPKASQAAAVEAVFKGFGITQNIWGNGTNNN